MSAYKALPDEALAICRAVAAPPRLIAHLTLVHDAACQLVARLRSAFPQLRMHESEILFGTATHDIGKADYRDELAGPGCMHEAHGAELLEKLGVSSHKARFAYTHANWRKIDLVPLEDLLVALADNCWKGKRVGDLESRVVAEIVRQTEMPKWEVFLALDTMLQDLGADAEIRLAWQAEFPA